MELEICLQNGDVPKSPFLNWQTNASAGKTQNITGQRAGLFKKVSGIHS
jgi:hypothetical protein